MSSEIRELHLQNGKSIFIEVQTDENIKLPALPGSVVDLPPGAEPTGLMDNFAFTMFLFRENIRNMAESVHEAIEDMSPDEWSVEMNIGFKGTATPIPFIASGELEGGVKVTVTWKKEEKKEKKND